MPEFHKALLRMILNALCTSTWCSSLGMPHIASNGNYILAILKVRCRILFVLNRASETYFSIVMPSSPVPSAAVCSCRKVAPCIATSRSSATVKPSGSPLRRPPAARACNKQCPSPGVSWSRRAPPSAILRACANRSTCCLRSLAAVDFLRKLAACMLVWMCCLLACVRL